jgi:hypothetical protein
VCTVHERENNQHRRGLRILVVDDNHDAASSMSMLLELDGHRTGHLRKPVCIEVLKATLRELLPAPAVTVDLDARAGRQTCSDFP